MQRLIKTEKDHIEALQRIETLMTQDISGSETDELELLAYLVDEYENREYPIGLPTPIEAIRFRMDQMGLKQKDLVPYIGSKSKVSEVLNGKRSLTLQMMRALNTGLGIPADVLLQAPDAEFPSGYDELNWSLFPIKELAKRGIVAAQNVHGRAEELMRHLIARAGTPPLAAACYRQGVFNGKDGDKYATLAWELVVRAKALEKIPSKKYDASAFTEKNLKTLAHFSILEDGPRLAGEYLANHGIVLVVEKAFKKTYLDGMALLLDSGTPVVGLTLRHDRVDYFWFTLLHELAHIIRHLNPSNPCILDFETGKDSAELLESEANEMALNATIPKSVWEKSEARKRGSKATVEALAVELEIHKGIVAGRVRKERDNYRIFHNMLGSGTVRRLF